MNPGTAFACSGVISAMIRNALKRAAFSFQRVPAQHRAAHPCGRMEGDGAWFLTQMRHFGSSKGGNGGRKRVTGKASRATTVPTSDGYHAAELRLNDAQVNGDSDATVVGMRGFFVGQKLDTTALATDVSTYYPLFAQIQGRHNVIFALDDEYAEHPDVGYVLILCCIVITLRGRDVCG